MDRRKFLRRLGATAAAVGVSQVIPKAEEPVETPLEPLGPFPVEGGPQYSAGRGQRWMVAGEHILNGDVVVSRGRASDLVWRGRLSDPRFYGIAVNKAHRGTPVKITVCGRV